MTDYNARYPVGTSVRVANLEALKSFRESWAYHHKLVDEQLDFAGQIAVVKGVGYYHGGDPLYELQGVPGTWHEVCLEPAPVDGAA